MKLLLEILFSFFRKETVELPAPAPKPEPIELPKEQVTIKSEEKEMPIAKPIVTGWVSELYESGGRGVGTVSTGKGDHGGASYGKHQLSSKAGTMAAFLKSAYGKPFTEFAGLVPATEEFNKVYKQVAAKRGAEFAAAQAGYIRETHYDVQIRKLAKAGFNFDDRHQAVREMVYSTAVQYGPNTSIILNSGIGLLMSDAEMIERVQSYKRDTVGVYFKSSSPAVQKSVANRADNEKDTLLKSLIG